MQNIQSHQVEQLRKLEDKTGSNTEVDVSTLRSVGKRLKRLKDKEGTLRTPTQSEDDLFYDEFGNLVVDSPMNLSPDKSKKAPMTVLDIPCVLTSGGTPAQAQP